MTHRVILQPRAVNDIHSAAQWIREKSQSPAVALRWVHGIRSKIATLANQPLRCPIDPDSEAYGEEVRLLLHGKQGNRYRILFAIQGDAVHILTVRHTAQRTLNEEIEDQDDDSVHQA